MEAIDHRVIAMLASTWPRDKDWDDDEEGVEEDGDNDDDNDNEDGDTMTIEKCRRPPGPRDPHAGDENIV